MEGKGLYSTYKGIEGPSGFSQKADEHLRKVVWLLHEMDSKFSPHKGVELLQRVSSWLESRLSAADPAKHGWGSGFWNQAIVLRECLEIPLGRQATFPEDLSNIFRGLAIQAIDQEIAVKDRHALAVTLGWLGDSRIVDDLRAHGNPEEHKGYVRISAGRYRYGKENQPLSIKAPFWLTRYPMTHSQFALFVDTGGYRKQEFWSKNGWSWLKKEKIDKPEYWRHPDYCAPNQPVAGVSFWEAEAFATWAGGSLPTEEQWEAAARGPEGYEYPWGGNWEDGICNSFEAGLKTTSAVGIFPRSRSKPFELEDMAGNVWEWCDSKEASFRVFRGGCWGSVAWLCRAAFRSRNVPQYRDFSLGFRVALVPSGGPAGSGKRERT
jgi:hypothetical protein